MGIAFSGLVIEKTIDVTGTGYRNGNQVRATFTGGDGKVLTADAIYDGSNWYWYGDRHWVDYNMTSAANIGGVLNLACPNPAGIQVSHADLDWIDNTNSYQVSINEGLIPSWSAYFCRQ